MSMRLTCPRCSTHFAAPENLGGELVGCPVCKAVLNIPPIIVPLQPATFWDKAAEWGLVATVLVVAFLGLMVDLLFLRTIVVALISLAGALLGGLAWRMQQLEGKREGDKWRWLESNLGIIAAYSGLGLCCIHFMFFAYCLILFVKDIGWHESIPPLVGALMLFLALNVGVAIGLHSLFERFGFYRAMSCIYIIVAGVLPFLALLAGVSLGLESPQLSARMFNPQALLEPAAREVAVRLAKEGAELERKRDPNGTKGLRKPATTPEADPFFPNGVEVDFGVIAAPAAPANAPLQETPAPAVAANDPPVVAAPVEPAAAPDPAPAAVVEIKPAEPVDVKPAMPAEAKPVEPPLKTSKPHILTVVGGRLIIVPSGKLLAPDTRLTPGTEIQVEYNNQWNIGRVVDVLPDGDVNLLWLDGEKNVPEVVPRHRIRLDLAKEGPDKVEDPLEIAKNNRRWIDVQGNVITARFISCDGLVLRLRTVEGKVVVVPFEGLSISDQEVVREIVTAKMDEKAGSQP